MKIIRKLRVDEVITESSKTAIRERLQKAAHQLDQESQQLLFEKRKLEKKQGVSKQDVHNRFQSEIRKRQEKRASIEFQLSQLDVLPIGSEILVQEVEALVEVEVGMKWDELTTHKIVIQDGTVIRIE
ncbi:YlqD protein [Terribacillus aidingensis]|uniref:YlqD protein n=1 Tax=Terribacillus aidingensis TaxID=586416 RepID=A0A285NKS7_9BACI|nr:YlqD family protein [Terribacillus aidingensis]SNZ09557.1 YlqD protein [Terribacillus aidingensis]